MDPIDKLRTKLASLPGFSEDTVQYVMARCRESLEAMGLKGKYAHLNFYANWCVHSKLSSSSICFDILRRITDIMGTDPASDPTQPWFNDAVVGVLDLKRLRQELLELCRTNGVSTVIFDRYEYWQHFAAYLRELISNKPIEFPLDPKGEGKRIFEYVEGIAKNRGGLAAKSLRITTAVDEKGLWTSLWEVELFRPYVTVAGPFTMNEHPF